MYKKDDDVKHTCYIDCMFCSSESYFYYCNCGSFAKEEALQFGIWFFTCTACFISGRIIGDDRHSNSGFIALSHMKRSPQSLRQNLPDQNGLRPIFDFLTAMKRHTSLAGDALYVDAHILKWKPIVNILGLHTAYELDRVAGRYMDLKEERESIRTVFLLSRDKPLDMFTLRQRYSLLRPLLDAEYGSASFINSDKPAPL